MSGRRDGGSDASATADAASAGQDAPFRKTLARVLLVQVVALILLWLLQSTFHS